MDPFTIAAIISAIAGAGGAYANKRAGDAENRRLQEFQQQRQRELLDASQRQRVAEMEGIKQSDAIRDQMMAQKAEQQKKFGEQISQFDMIEKSKHMGDKQNERIESQRGAVEQARADNKLRAGSDVKGRISESFDTGVASRSSQVLSRADQISQLMGRLSGTKADMMREGNILSGMGIDQKVLAGNWAEMNNNVARQNQLNQLNKARAGNTREEKFFKFDPTSSLGNALGNISTISGIVGLGGGAASAGLFGKGAQTWAQGLPGVTMGGVKDFFGMGPQPTAPFSGAGPMQSYANTAGGFNGTGPMQYFGS